MGMSSLRSIMFAGLAATALASPALASVKDGIDAWMRGDYAAAVAEWRKLALTGDADAQFNLGQAYKYGRGVPADLKIAASWYRKAALQGHMGAAANLGAILFQNGDRAAAMPWLTKAADGGDARAQYIVGTAAFNGDYAAKDWPRAYALMTRAGAAGLPQAANSLATMDRYIPMDQRQQGVALAAAMARQGAEPSAPNPVNPSQSAIATMQLPPSKPARVAAATPPAPVPARAAPAAVRPTVAAKPAAPLKPAPAPTKAAASAGGWRIQLGAFGNPAAANTLWARLGTRPGLAGLRPFVTKAGPVTRLQAGPFAGKAAANSACQAAKAAGAACFLVAP